MTLELFIRYLHFVSILLVAGTLVTEHMMLEKQMTRTRIAKLARIDALYGISAIILLATGLTMWLWVGKGADFYSKNPAFHTKLTLFVVLAILSIFPTLFFLKNRKGDGEELVEVPKKIYMYLRIELLILFVIPILAVLMARGIGF